ncbi:MAG: hypothetical protein ACYS9Y_04000 [Planctomycetota bacterium]|jgi:predicted DNA-binding protein YlxM (UPF0122 family)
MESMHENVTKVEVKARKRCRDRIDMLKSRVELLTGKDRVLMTMYLKYGNTFYQMARLAGVNEANVARRIYRVTKRLIDGEYITCLRNRDKFSEVEMAIAKDYFIRGLSIKKIAGRRKLSYYRVREILKKIQSLIKVIDAEKTSV